MDGLRRMQFIPPEEVIITRQIFAAMTRITMSKVASNIGRGV